MTKTYFILFFHIITFPLSAITLKGKIIDANTSQPLSFVNIGVKGTRYGTASNSTGNFVLNIPDKYKNGIIRFSCIGYEAKERSIKELLNQQIVKLTPSVIRLNARQYPAIFSDQSCQENSGKLHFHILSSFRFFQTDIERF
jgi:hypothetical protein